MDSPLLSIEFLILCSVQITCVLFSLIVLLPGVKRYRNTSKSEIYLRKSVKYFVFILITIICAAFWSLVVNFYFIITSGGIVAGYLMGGGLVCVFVNIFCANSFLNYLLHPERRKTKYPLGIYLTIGIILVWIPAFYPGAMTSVLVVPLTENLFIYAYLFSAFFLVYGILAFEFFKHSYKSSDKKEKYRFFVLGLCALSTFFSFFLLLGLVYTWIMLLNSIVLLYLGYNFPKFFQKVLKIED